MSDQSHLSDTQRALNAPVVTHGNFYYSGEGVAALTFIQAMLTVVIEAAPPGYKFLKVKFHGLTTHGRGYDAGPILVDIMKAAERTLTPGVRVAVGYELQVMTAKAAPVEGGDE